MLYASFSKTPPLPLASFVLFSGFKAAPPSSNPQILKMVSKVKAKKAYSNWKRQFETLSLFSVHNMSAYSDACGYHLSYN